MTAVGFTECAACGGPLGCPTSCEALGHRICRDGFDVGPTVDLCHGCGAFETPTPAELWERIARRLVGAEATIPPSQCRQCGRLGQACLDAYEAGRSAGRAEAMR